MAVEGVTATETVPFPELGGGWPVWEVEEVLAQPVVSNVRNRPSNQIGRIGYFCEERRAGTTGRRDRLRTEAKIRN